MMVSTCQICGLEAPVKYVNFHQNIGMLVSRSTSDIAGNLCRRCIKRCFKSYTLTTFFPWLVGCDLIRNYTLHTALKCLQLPTRTKPPGAGNCDDGQPTGNKWHY